MKPVADLWSVTAFSFTSELMARKFSSVRLLSGIADLGLAKNIEVDGPQFFRDYPDVRPEEVDQVRRTLALAGLRIVIIGGYMDRFHGSDKPVDSELVMQKLHKQLKLARQFGAYGLRLQFDALRDNEVDQAIEWANESNVKILLELQGSARPEMPNILRIFDVLQERNHPMLRVLLDSSLMMRGLPTTYIQFLKKFGLEMDQIKSIENAWKTLSTQDYRGWLLERINTQKLPASLLSQLPTLTARFGHSRASDWRKFSGLFDCLHLKYWDQDDSSGALSEVAREALSLYKLREFPGFIVSEWGGHDWLSLEEATGFEMTAQHKERVLPVIEEIAAVA